MSNDSVAEYVKRRNKFAERLLGEDCTLHWYPSTLAILEDLMKQTGDDTLGKIVDRCWNLGAGQFEAEFIKPRVEQGQAESEEEAEDETK